MRVFYAEYIIVPTMKNKFSPLLRKFLGTGLERGTEFKRLKIVSRGKRCVLNLINDNNPFFMNFYFLDNRHSSVLRTAFRRRVSTRVPSSFSFLLSFFLSRRQHKIFEFCVRMISGSEHQKIFV
jgi:hypothetical protein